MKTLIFLLEGLSKLFNSNEEEKQYNRKKI